MLEPMLDHACQFSMGEYTTEDLIRGVLDERFQLWASIKDDVVFGTAVTELVVYPQKTVCNVIAMAGKEGSLHVLLDLQSQIEAWAISEGASVLKAYVRPGLMKTLRKRGFSQEQYIVAKDLKRSLH